MPKEGRKEGKCLNEEKMKANGKKEKQKKGKKKKKRTNPDLKKKE